VNISHRHRTRARLARALAPLGLLLLVAGCSSDGLDNGGIDASVGSFATTIYDQVVDNGITIPAVQAYGPAGLNPQFARREVDTPASLPAEPVGTIVVDTPNRYLYLTEAGGKSMRYGIGVGREGFAWAGTATIKAKAAWPTWTPPPEMLARDPSSRPYANGMPGGLDNPLGARAMYLYIGDQDTLYRLHGTTEAWSIGQAVSSGCVRLLDQDVIDLYNRVSIGTKVVVIGDPTLMKAAGAAVAAAPPLFPVAPPSAGIGPIPGFLPPAQVGPA
jgi:lipoprotein-anchoring transpeptidase ErfK/SrfK